jgi:hypothetical protein
VGFTKSVPVSCLSRPESRGDPVSRVEQIISVAANVPPIVAREQGLATKCRTIFRCLAIASGFVQAWSSRFWMDVDGVSYLDMGQAYFQGNWKVAVNAYWSPLYSWILGLTLRAFQPSSYWQSTVVHLVNFAVFLIALLCFEFFLRALIRFLRRTQSPDDSYAPLPDWAWWALGYVLFLGSSLYLVSLSLVTPDLCVTALVYLAVGILLRIRDGKTSWMTFTLFGVVLGFGYLAKSAMFPLAFVFLGASLLAVGKFRLASPRVLLSAVVFLLVSGPLILALSLAKGRLTFGDTGRIAYAEMVTGVTRYGHWQGEGNTGTPKHPVRKILESPPLYEFATPVGGTYPPWYDASYWLEGVVPHFDLRGQLRVLGDSLRAYFQILSQQRELAVGFLALLLLERRWRALGKELMNQWHLWLPAAAACAMFALVLVEPRYVAGFVLLLWAGAFSALRLSRAETSERFVQSIVLAVVLVMGAKVVRTLGSDLAGAMRPGAHVQWQVAEDLRQIGLRPGDRVALIGHTTAADYWAYLAEVSIAAEVGSEGVNTFWSAGPELQSRVLQTFYKFGAKAVVTSTAPPPALPPGWRKLGDTGFFAYTLCGARVAASHAGEESRGETRLR